MEALLSAVTTLVLIMDPFGNIPMFISALKKVSPERRRRVLIRELLIALAIMIVFLFIGNSFLALLHIKEYSLGIAGGLILFIISIKLVFNNECEAKSNPKEEEPFIVPLAIPLIAGPASLSLILILAAGTAGIINTLIAVIAASVVNSAVLLLSSPISDMLGKKGIAALERLSGMLLVLMSVNMIMNGVSDFMKGT
jgi:multiple antibiotic resistance protein